MPTTNSAYAQVTKIIIVPKSEPLNPISLYAKAVEVEERLLEHSNAVSFRLATVFGMSPERGLIFCQ